MRRNKKVRATNKFSISYVSSLLTSIPLKETIDIAVDLLFEHNPDFKITKNELKKLFDFATSGTHYGSFYDQIDGVAMGSPLGPVLANLFMGHHETNWLQVFKDCEIILYRRYVGDIISLINSESDAKFYEFLNKQHPNIKFTFEKLQNNRISFLDILIKNNGENFSTTIFCKTTAIGLFTSYLSFTPLSYKIGLVKTLIHRAFKICSKWCLFHDEVNNINKYLEKNLYPRNFIDREIKMYLEKQFNIELPNVSNTIKFNYYKLPYIGHFSKTTQQKSKKVCDQYCKDLSLKIVFTPFKVGDLYSVKDAIPKLLKFFVVYKFVCPGCNACYIGERTRHLSTRIEEHLEKDKKPHISKHLDENHHCKNLSTPDCFQIIDSASSNFWLKLKEAMYITWTKPSLNRQLKRVSISITV